MSVQSLHHIQKWPNRIYFKRNCSPPFTQSPERLNYNKKLSYRQAIVSLDTWKTFMELINTFRMPTFFLYQQVNKELRKQKTRSEVEFCHISDCGERLHYNHNCCKHGKCKNFKCNSFFKGHQCSKHSVAELGTTVLKQVTVQQHYP